MNTPKLERHTHEYIPGDGDMGFPLECKHCGLSKPKVFFGEDWVKDKSMNWKTKFDKEFGGIQRGGFEYPVQYELKSFITSLLTEVIDEIPTTVSDLPSTAGGGIHHNLSYFKQQLKEKYL